MEAAAAVRAVAVVEEDAVVVAEAAAVGIKRLRNFLIPFSYAHARNMIFPEFPARA